MVELHGNSINPIAMQIGTLIGLFIKQGDNYVFNNRWFNDPWSYISAIPSNPEMFELLATVMTSMNGTALGTPRQINNRTWYPIFNPLTESGKDAQPTGIYIVAGTPVADRPTELGVGTLYDWTYSDFSIQPYAYFPILNLPANSNDSFAFILGQGMHPVEAGINVTGSNGVFSTGTGDASLSFDGFSAASNIYFSAGKYPSLDLTLLNLKLPGERQGANRSLFDLILNASVQQSITVALSVLGSQLSQKEGAAGTAGKMIIAILELLGLLGPVPSIAWDALVKDPSLVVKIFTEWLQNISSNADLLKAWLNDWYCLFKGQDPTDGKLYVTGDGTRLTPFSANLFSVKFTETLSIGFDFTFATQKTPEGTLKMYPGFKIISSPTTPIPSMKEFGVQVVAAAEILCYTVPPPGSSTKNTIDFFPTYSIMATAANTIPGKPLFAVSDLFGSHEVSTSNPAAFSIGSMNVGFVYDAAVATSKVPSPNFRLLQVQSAIGTWPLIDLSNFSVESIEKAIGPIVSQAIKSFFGEDNKYAQAFTAVLGIDPPTNYTGEWPLKNRLLLSASELTLLIKNPFAAIGAYYARCLSTNDDEGKPLFQYLVPAFSTLLGSDSTAAIGDGTQAAPWKIPLLQVGSATIDLAIWQLGNDELAIAFDFEVPLPISAISATFKLHAAIMVMQLPGNDGSKRWDAAWMQAITGSITIKDASKERLQTPEIGGVALAAADVYVEGGWKNTGTFFVEAGIQNVQLIASTGTIDLGNLFISSEGWSIDQLKQFTPAIVNGIGLLMLENGGTVGVLLTTVLGLLPNLPQIFDGHEHPEYNFPIPQYLIIPDDWPTLTIEHYSNPWQDVLVQMSKLYASSTFMIPLMQLVGWGITGTVPGAPDTIPIGTMADPWTVNLPDVWNIDLLTWKEQSQAGFGVQRKFGVSAAEGVEIATILRADVPGFMLDGATGPTTNYPGFAFVNLIQNPDVTKPLVNMGGLVIDKVQIGILLQWREGALTLVPLFRFQNSRLSEYEIFRDVELIPVEGKPQFTSSDAITAFNSLINALMQQLSATIQTKGFRQLEAFLDILTIYRVLNVTDNEGQKTFSFNTGAWASILANPGGYLFTKTQEVLNNDRLCADFVKALAQLMGYDSFKMPIAWQGIQYLLRSLGLAKEYGGYFIPEMNGWLALIKDPVGYLQLTVSHLFNTPNLIKQLVTDVSGLISMSKSQLQTDFGKFFMVDTSGTILTVQIPVDKIVNIGDELRLYASLVLDVNAFTLTNSVALGSRTLNSSIAFDWTPQFKDGRLTGNYGFYLKGIPGEPQAFAPLALWPFPADTAQYLRQIGYQVPITLLSSFSVKYLNEYVVPANPSVNNIFSVLGLTTHVEGKEQIKPLTGIFMNPVQWLLSPDVLGNERGGIDLSKLGALLYAITDAAGIRVGNVTLKAYEHNGQQDGVELTGLPWGVTFILYANNSEGANLIGTFSPKLPAPAPHIELTAGVSFGTANGVGIDGTISMNFDLGENAGGGRDTLGITATYAKRKFALTAKANTSEFLLLPFGGLNQFLNEGTANTLLTIIGNKLFSAYHDYVAKNPTTALKPFVESIELLTGITSGDTLFSFFDALYKDPLGQFTEANITSLLPRINQFVSNILTLQGFSVSADNKMLTYQHTFASLPGARVVIHIGLRNSGGTTLFGLWLEPVASFSWISMGLRNTGVGVAMPVNYSNPNLRYEVNISMGANFSGFNIPNAPQPTLLFGLTGDLSNIQGPNLSFYPVTVSQAAGTLSASLLPTPALLIAGKQDVTLTQWMINFGTEFLIPFIANTALGVQSVKDWLNKTKIGNVVGAPGQILVDWGLLVKQDDSYFLNNLRTAFDINDPVGIVTKLIFSALNLLDGQRVVPIKEHGIYIQSETDSGGKRYGLRIQITDIVVTSSLNTDGAKLIFQLGKYFGDQTKDNNWTGLQSDPGFVVYFINKPATGNSLSFLPKFELISVGLDFAGANMQRPLINVNGVSIQAVQPRVYVSLDFNGTLKTNFGAGTMIYNIGVPLGPGFNNQGKSTNPVAQNLLTSGGNPGRTDAINPSFSVSASYVYNTQAFTLQLYDANTVPTDKVWIAIMRAFGPLQCRKVGIGWKGNAEPKRLDFLFDGQVSLAGLTANLIELGIGIPISDPTNYGAYSLDLAGLDVSYDAGAISIGGGFLKDDRAGYIQYTGQAKIVTPALGVGAFGSYALIDGHPSLFIFAYLNAPLGGPPYFFIRGLSGGFGYNRTINIPPANQIENFPFVVGIENPTALGAKPGQTPTNEDALRALGTSIVPPQLGSYWVAGGLMVSSFELIDSKAVLMVIFGKDFEIALLGLSGLRLPKRGKTYVGAQIAFKVTYKVSTGLLAMEAVLTSNSYVIDPNCKLTGGLAFYVWFKNQPDTGARAGEFVFTLGGYNPVFKKPSYFPDEPRLGFSWSVGNNVSIKGGAYFALTPSAVMAGGSLEAVYQTGNLKAWFTAFADFLIMWNPFFYDIHVGVSVGASYTVHFIWTTTFRVELGAEVHIWGPAMAGTATVHWWVISFTVDFGATGTRPNDSRIIPWTEFQPYFLPKDQAPAAPPQQQPESSTKIRRAAQAMTVDQAPVTVQQVTLIKQVSGLIKELPNPNADISPVSPTLWQIGADGFSFTVSTVIPLNKITVTGTDKAISSDVKFGIRPMGSVVFGTPGQLSTLVFTLLYNNDVYKDFGNWSITGTVNGMPESLWGTVNNGKTSIDAKIIPDVLVGLSARIVSGADNLPPNGPPMFPLSNLGYAAWAWRKLTLANNPHLHPTAPARQTNESLVVIEDTVMAPAVVTIRKAILNAVVSAGINVQTDGRLDQMAAFASDTFQSFPMLGQLGSLGYTSSARLLRSTVRVSQTFTRSQPRTVVATLARTQQTEPALMRAVMLAYPQSQLPSPVFMAASLNEIKQTRPLRGKMYSTAYATLRQVEAVTQSRVLRTGASINTPSFEVYPGISVLYDLDPVGPPLRIALSGNGTVFAAWFDAHTQLTGCGLLVSGTNLPVGTAELIVSGLDLKVLEMPYAYGWHVTSQLTLVNPNALVGTGAIIVPDCPIRIRGKITSGDYGLITGEAMIRANKMAEDGASVQAGIKTIMPQSVKTVAVLARKADAGAAFDSDSITTRIRVSTDNGPEYLVLGVAAVINGLAEVALLYTLPALTGYDFNTLHTAASNGTTITGVMGMAEPIAAVEANWKDIVLQPAIPQPYILPESGTTVTIEQL